MEKREVTRKIGVEECKEDSYERETDNNNNNNNK